MVFAQFELKQVLKMFFSFLHEVFSVNTFNSPE